MQILQCLGVGSVASTKQTNSKEVWVYIPFNHAAADGGIGVDAERVKQTTQDAAGKTVVNDIMQSNRTEPATWIALGEPNRLTPPDVQEGSPVAIYQIMGSNTYFWTTYGLAATTFRLETIIYGYSGVANLDANAPFDINNFYTMTIDTRSGVTSYRNSNKNGEPTIIEITHNAKQGTVQLSGARKTMLVFDDVNEVLAFTNRSESLFTINKKNIGISAADQLILSAENNISISCKTLGINAEKGSISAKQFLLDVPELQHNGVLQNSGGITSDGKINGKGGMSSGNNDLDAHGHDYNDGITGPARKR